VRTALLVALAIALAVVLWWIRDDERARAERPEPPREAVEPLTSEPELAEVPAPAEETEETARPATTLPPDPLERGECALYVRFVDAATGQPVATSVDLWRLNAPGNEDWLEGDQLQRSAEIPAEGVTLHDLPEGEYRPVCAAERITAEDPPPVRVAGPLTAVTIAIELPGTFHVFLKVYDANGRLVPEAGVRRSGESWSAGRETPAWRKARELRNPPPGNAYFGVSRSGGAGRFSGGHSAARPQPPTGFRLGPVPESTKGRRITWHYRAETEGLNDVVVYVRGDHTDERTYVGVMAPIETLLRDVRLPDGRLATTAGARIYARCSAVLAQDATQPDFWRHVPIEVNVEVPGHKEFSFEQPLTDPPPVHVLEPE